MFPEIRTVLGAVALALTAWMPAEAVLAACNATVNGRPMTAEECATAIRVYGGVVPGDYYVDGQGNWVNLNNPMHRGNSYRDGQRPRMGSSGGGFLYDPTGGCEGGSCVNIID